MDFNILLLIISPYTAFVPIIYFFIKNINNKEILIMDRNNYCLYLIFLSSVCSSVVNKSIVSFVLSFVIILLIIVFNGISKKNLLLDRLFYKVWKYSLIPLGIGFFEKILSYFINMNWISNIFWSPTYIISKNHYRIYSTFGNPNVAGAWFGMMVLVSIYLYEKQNNRDKIKYFISTILFLISLGFSGSKGAIIGLIVGLVFYKFTRGRWKNFNLIGTVLVGIAMLVLLSPEVNHKFQTRIYLWNECIQMFLQKPMLGWGITGIINKIGDIHAHNIWVSMATMFGIVGLSALIIMQIKAIRALYNIYKYNREETAIICALYMFILAHGIVDFTIMVPQIAISFFSITAIINNRSINYKENLGKYSIKKYKGKRAF